MEKIGVEEYNDGLLHICAVVDKDFDCIVALKRSGWIMGSFLSNQLSKPLFTTSEIRSIPDKFKGVLIVDDKVCTGKSINIVRNRLLSLDKNVKTACLFIQRNYFTDYSFKNLNNKTATMWYER